MIGKATLKAYGYKDIQQYYDYIVESKINGNHSQVRDLISKFNKDQREEFAKWLVDSKVPEQTEILLMMV